MISREDVLAQALSLPAADQEYVADMLERRIATTHFSAPEIGELWAHEIDRRIASYDGGDTTALEFERSLEHMQQALTEHRRRKVSQ